MISSRLRQACIYEGVEPALANDNGTVASMPPCGGKRRHGFDSQNLSCADGPAMGSQSCHARRIWRLRRQLASQQQRLLHSRICRTAQRQLS
eukprot:364409-Chlamydomonas_euryale.AAC.16